MTNRFDGANVLITGAASGIGRATALAAAEKGAKLVLTDIQGELLDSAATEIRERGGTVLAARAADIAHHDVVHAFAREVHAEHGGMDIVMNVAGISTWGSVDRLAHDDWKKCVDIDLMGPIHVIEAFIPPMIKAGNGGHLVNVSSAAALLGLPWHAPYSAAKFGLRGISEVLRFDLEPHDIHVSLVCPGAVKTPLVESVNIVGLDRDHPVVKSMTDRFARRAKSPEQVAGTIVKGVQKRRYLVYTSRDIQAAYLLQRLVPPAYNAIMRLANRRMRSVARKASA